VDHGSTGEGNQQPAQSRSPLVITERSSRSPKSLRILVLTVLAERGWVGFQAGHHRTVSGRRSRQRCEGECGEASPVAAQLHDLRAAILVWATKYGHRAWLRQLDHPLNREMEDAALRTIARLDGTPFPSTARLVSRWLRGRMPIRKRSGRDGELETAYCAEIVAITYEAMGLLPGGRRPNWYDPGRFWSGNDLNLSAGSRLGGEIAVQIPPSIRGAAQVPTAND
jgi:hypothetical protein